MKVLVMRKNYLKQILNGEKTYDARTYNTDIRGTIGLLDSQSNKIIGLVDLTNTRQITFEDYLIWHGVEEQYFNLYKKSEAFAYDFTNPRTLAMPIKIERKKSEIIWCDVDDKLINDIYFEVKLF